MTRTRLGCWLCCCLWMITSVAEAQDGRRRRIHLSLEDRSVEAWALNKGGLNDPDRTKQYFWCKGQRIHITEGGAEGDLLDGPYVEFHPNGQLRTKGKLSKGLRDGTWQDWDVEGHLLHTANWRNGRLHGKQWNYDPRGGKPELERYRRGKVVEPHVHKKKERPERGKHRTEKQEERPNDVGPTEPAPASEATPAPPVSKRKERLAKKRKAQDAGAIAPAGAEGQAAPDAQRKPRKRDRRKQEQPEKR